MTKAEAIDRLTLAKKWSLDVDFIKALQVAIEALEFDVAEEIIGSIVKLTKPLSRCNFEISQKLTIREYDPDFGGVYKCYDQNGNWHWLSREEFEIIEP